MIPLSWDLAHLAGPFDRLVAWRTDYVLLYKTASGLAGVGYWIFSSIMQHSERGFK